MENDFLVVDQFAISKGQSHRRPDLVIFLNGLPLGVIELKNATIWDAWNQLQTYKEEIPLLFHFNEVLIVSDGLQAESVR